MNAPKKLGAILFVCATVLLDSIGFGIIIPVMPELIMEVSGKDLSAAALYGGWLLFVYALMQFFAAPILGNLSDRFGRRPVLLASLLAFAADYLILAWAPTILWLFCGRLIAGIASSTYGIANAIIADVCPAEERAPNFGLVSAAFGVGFILGPVLGGFLGAMGSRVPFYAAAALSFLNFVYGCFFVGESLPEAERRPFLLQRANPLGAFKSLLAHPSLLGFAACVFMFQLGHMVFPSVWSFYGIEKFSWTEREIGYSLAAVGVCMIFVSGFLTRVVIPRIGLERTAVLGLLSSIFGFLGFAFAPSTFYVYVFIAVGALGDLFSPAIQGLMSRATPADAQGELQGVLSSIGSITAILSPPMMTMLFSSFSQAQAEIYFPGAPFLAAALFTMICLGILVSLRQARANKIKLPALP